MSDTPETDAARHDLTEYGPPTPCSYGDWVAADFACKLERERDEARGERDEAMNEIEGWRNKWNIAVEMAARAEVERDKALAALSYGKGKTLLNKWLEAIKERNEARDESEEQARLLGMSAEREESMRGKLFLAERELAKLDEGREQIKELIYIAERAIALAEIDFENDKFGVVSELRDALMSIKMSTSK